MGAEMPVANRQPPRPLPQTQRENRPTIGLIAGWGRFPVLVAEAASRRGYRVACVAIRDHADPVLEKVCDHVRWMGVAKFGGHLRFFRRHEAHWITMAGKLFKSELLFQGSIFWRHAPDWRCLRTLAPHFITRRQDTRDDSLLTTITDSYLACGITVCPATDLAPELLVKEGLLTQIRPTAQQRRDIAFGWHIAKQMGGIDIGQSITVKDGTVLAVEAVEGTDAAIERTGQLCRKGGWTLIKVAKPDQDMRFDVPTIGPQTIDRVRAAGGTAIAIEADKTIVVDREEVIAAAHRAGIAIIALVDGATAERSQAA
jgi:DUF1009 family protein